jgi:hypothetical protein
VCFSTHLQPDRWVDVRVVVLGEEPVALEPARRHQDEDLECGVVEPESGRRLLAEHADLQVDVLAATVVDVADLRTPLGVRGEVLEARDRRSAQQLAKVVVATNPALAIAQDVRNSFSSFHDG